MKIKHFKGHLITHFSGFRKYLIVSRNLLFRLLHRNHLYQQPLFSTPAVSTPPPLIPPSSSTDVRRVCVDHQSSSSSYLSFSSMIIVNILILVIKNSMIITKLNKTLDLIRRVRHLFDTKIPIVNRIIQHHLLSNISIHYQQSI